MSGPRVLIAEDEVALAVGLEDDLRLEGYDVVVVRDGPTASRVALNEPFDVIVLDVMLPGRDGFDVCRDLRRAGRRTPVVFLTAKTQESDKVLGFETGGDDYVTKPFSPRELRARLKALVRRGQGDIPAVLSFGDLRVDLGACRVQRHGSDVPLTTIEFKLLACFIRRRGQVVTRSQLLDEVWGSSTHVTDRVVDTHVSHLRQKIEVEPTSPRLVASVRGIGYRFDG